jgi:hypothetical protein
MTSPFVYLPGARLSQAELTAACLDGHVVALGEGFVPADVVESAALRGASVAGILGPSLAATHTTAAWILGGIDDPPARHTVQRAVAHRLHHVIHRRLAYRDPFVPPEDLLRVGGALVTTVARTAADLARTPDAAHVDALRRWAAQDDAVLAAARSWLDGRPHIPHRRRAQALLRTLASADQEDVTRYTS